MFTGFDIFDRRYVAAVSTAIDAKRMSYHVQGIHDVRDRDTILYGECLARLIGPQGQIYEASEFVPALEILGETPVLDRCMVRLVLDRLEADPLAVLGCNISADTISKEKEWQCILDQVEERKHLADRLILEIIETRPLGILSMLNAHLTDAQNLGCRIAIDDFGAGYLPPVQLYSLNPDIIKLDVGFIWAVRQHGGWLGSLNHIIQFAASFAPVVIVEGVECEMDLYRAQQAGTTHVQGWHLSMPVPLTGGYTL
ncbi:EAL domain-containing protein [Pseudochrobactrum sp. MP213Fo]|uniref:EAL domain-containing protein n=1 Tax=Pseudochrobactrum sp. MP213Fo TaxID=3022250 RepID=UPI003BA0079D